MILQGNSIKIQSIHDLELAIRDTIVKIDFKILLEITTGASVMKTHTGIKRSYTIVFEFTDEALIENSEEYHALRKSVKKKKYIGKGDENQEEFFPHYGNYHLQALTLNFLKNIPGFLNEGVDIPTLSNCHNVTGKFYRFHFEHSRRIEIIKEEDGSKVYQRTQSNTIIIQDDRSPPPTAPIQSQSNQTNDEQGREPTPPNKVQGLITELSTLTKGESDEADENEIPD
ncbi:6351_t:CDS:2 [Ambispora leptoticha]|uniref:6351_t:CDS:1 n=1 Tax=Ambispora leptoticha TaxID=144679 RepID=A0A9N9F785_9GLOM|nr:6351_t:CDS:2 [Ambispora leptoticha]